MVRVRIDLYATLREKYGKFVEVECKDSIEDAFLSASRVLGEDFLKEVFEDGKIGKFRKDRIILVNGRNIKDEAVKKIGEGTRISVFPPVAGG